MAKKGFAQLISDFINAIDPIPTTSQEPKWGLLVINPASAAPKDWGIWCYPRSSKLLNWQRGVIRSAARVASGSSRTVGTPERAARFGVCRAMSDGGNGARLLRLSVGDPRTEIFSRDGCTNVG